MLKIQMWSLIKLCLFDVSSLNGRRRGHAIMSDSPLVHCELSVLGSSLEIALDFILQLQDVFT